MARKTANQRAREIEPLQTPETQDTTVSINDLLITIGEQQVQIRSLGTKVNQLDIWLGQRNELIAHLRELLKQNGIEEGDEE